MALAGVLADARKRRLGLVVVLVVAALLRVYRIGHENFWIDEVFQLKISSQPLLEIIANYRPHVDYGLLVRDQAPLSHLLYHFVAGPRVGEAWVRLPSMVASLVNLAVVYALAVRLLPYSVAFLGVAMLAVSPLDVWYAQESRFYALWVLFSTLSYWTLVHVIDSGERRWWVGYCVFAIAGLYTCIMHALVLLAQGVSILAYAWSRRDALRAGASRSMVMGLAISAIVIATATAPLTYVVVSEIDRGAGTPRETVTAALPYTVLVYALGYAVGPTVAELHESTGTGTVLRRYPEVVVWIGLFAFAALAGLRAIGARTRASIVLLPWLMAPPLSVFAVSLASNVSYNVRYSLASLPAFFLLVAAGCSTLRIGAVRNGVGAVVFGCLFAALGSHYFVERYDKEQVREAVAFMNDVQPARVPVVLLGQTALAFEYYMEGTGLVASAACSDAVKAETAGSAAPLPDGPVWLAIGRDWNDDAGRCLKLLGSAVEVAERHEFVGIELIRLRRRCDRAAC